MNFTAGIIDINESELKVLTIIVTDINDNVDPSPFFLSNIH